MLRAPSELQLTKQLSTIGPRNVKRSSSNIPRQLRWFSAIMKNSWATPATQCLKLGGRRVSRPETIQKRGLQDVQITRTGRPIIRVQGGR